MKKHLLSALAACLALAAQAFDYASLPKYDAALSPAFTTAQAPAESRADDGCRIKFCGSLGGWLPAPVDCDELYVYVPVPADIATALSGNQVTSITLSAYIVSATTLPGVAFITEDPLSDPVTATNFNIRDSKGAAVNQQTVTLETPYTIKADTEFYIGYCVKGPVFDKDYPIGAVNEYNPLAGFVQPVKNGESIGFGSMGYNIYLYANTVGEKTSLDGTCMLVGSAANNFTLPVIAEGDNVIAQVAVMNFGSTATTMEYTYSYGGGDPVASSARVSLKSNVITYAYLPAGKAPLGRNNVKVHLSKIDTYDIDKTIEQPVIGVPKDNDYKRKYYVEEFTGTWCQYCPRGIVAFEGMQRYYPDEFIGVAIHAGDDMAEECFSDILSDFCAGYPTAAINRDQQYVIDASFDYLSGYYDEIWSEQKAPVKIDWNSVTFNADTTALTAKVTTTFAYDETDAKYAVAIVVTEDSILGIQTNGFAGQNVDLDGWETKPKYVPWLYSHVGRQITDPYGVEGSVPASITAGTPNTCSIEVPLANLNKKNNIEQVIALVLDTRTGVVVNAEAKRFDGGESSGIESAAADASATVTGAAGEIIINGNFSRADVYTLSGVLVGRTSALAPGVYVVNVDGRAHKVMVR